MIWESMLAVLHWLLALIERMVVRGGILGWLPAGLLILFFSALFNATILLPIPFNIVVFSLGGLAAAQNWGLGFVLLVGISSGIGAAIGELTGYYAGFYGGKALKGFSLKFSQQKIEGFRQRIGRYGMLIIFGGAIIPFPFDLIGIAAGLSRFDVKKFFVATAAGKVLRDTIICLAGFYGVELIRTTFGIF